MEFVWTVASCCIEGIHRKATKEVNEGPVNYHGEATICWWWGRLQWQQWRMVDASSTDGNRDGMASMSPEEEGSGGDAQ